MRSALRVGLVVLGLSALCVLNLAATANSPEEKGKPALTGAWQRQGSELKLEFGDEAVLRVYPHGDKALIGLVCKYTVEKDGTLKVKVTDYEGKDEFKEKVKTKVPVGQEFGLKWTAKDGKATLEILKGENTDLLKGHMDGEYEEKQ